MPTVYMEARIKKATIDEERLSLELSDGRMLKTPLAWFPSLLSAGVETRNNFRIIGLGIGIHWPDIDEDISLAGLLAGPSVS